MDVLASEAAALRICWWRRSGMQKRRRREGGEGGSRTHASLPEQEVGILSPPRQQEPEPGLRAPAEPAGGAGQLPSRACTPRAMDGLPQLVLWVTAAGKELILLPPSSFGANSLLCPGTQTYFVAPSLLPLKAVKRNFRSSGGKGGGRKYWHETYIKCVTCGKINLDGYWF